MPEGVAPPQASTENWREFLDRTCIIHVSQPRAVNLDRLLGALRNAKDAHGELINVTDHIDFVGPIDMGRKWQARFSTKHNATTFLENFPTFSIMPESGSVMRCPTSSFLEDVRVLKVRGMPAFMPADLVKEALNKRPEIKSVLKYRWDRYGVNSSEGTRRYIYNGVLSVTIKTDCAEDIPDTIEIEMDPYDHYGKSTVYPVSLPVMGLLPRCHKCHNRGHLAKECKACAHCRSLDHDTQGHWQAIKDRSLRQHITANADPPSGDGSAAASSPTPMEVKERQQQEERLRALEKKRKAEEARKQKDAADAAAPHLDAINTQMSVITAGQCSPPPSLDNDSIGDVKNSDSDTDSVHSLVMDEDDANGPKRARSGDEEEEGLPPKR